MINFCVEPKKPCNENQTKELDFKINKCYSSIYSRLCCHIDDSVSHISQEERDEWNEKASNSALLDLQNQLNEVAGDGDNSIKKEILIEVSRQIADAITDLNIGEYAKKKYVDDAISNINFDQYVTKADADSTYLKLVDYTKFDTDSYYTKAEIQNIIKNSDIVKDYSIESFTIENNKLILTQKNGGQFGVTLSENGSGSGVDADYVQQQLLNYIKKNTLSKLIINDKVYSLEDGHDIKIPTSGTGSSIDPTTFGYYKSYFKETTSNSSIPNKPSANKPPQDGSGWSDTTPDYRAGYYIWMTQVFVNGNGQYGEYMKPICLTGSAGEDGSGSAGEDGSGISFIYKTSINGQGVTNPGIVTVDNGVPQVPVGWNDHPSGVTKDVPYEYCSCVTSNKGEWGTMWIEPFIWSHFGQNGMDGDGVEYIYYVSLTTPTNNLPESWTNDEGFQNNEYIKHNSGWTDNPQDLEEFGPGYKQWVSVRKRYSDNSGQDSYWHAYSSPALWSYYSKDGIASALIMDVVGENRYLYLTQDNKNKSFQSSSMAYMYNDGSPIDFTLSIDSFVDSAGNDYSSYKDQYFTINGNQININIPENSLSFNNDIYYKVILSGKPKLTSISSQTRQTEIQLFGFVRGADGSKGDPGDNAISYDIKTSASAINYQDGSMHPNLISVYVAKSDGSQITNITPSNSSDWHFQYSTNDGDTWNEISSDQIQTEGESGMLFKATNGTITLSEYVPIVKSGIDGLNGVTYQLQLSNISLSYAPAEGQDYNLQMSCNINLYRNESSVGDKDANIKMQLNSNDKTDLQYSSDHWVATVDTTVQSKSSVVTIYAYNKNGAYLTSMAIPVSASGKKGDPGDSSTGQTFKGSPLRMSREVDGQITTDWKQGVKYYDGKRDVEDGVFYQDVVLYNNMYYACVNTDLGEQDQWKKTPDTAPYFSAFTISPNIVADLVITNKAFIKEISSNELVIFDGDKIVAGMTSSKTIYESSPLSGKVTTEGKGDVRIWAGEISDANLTTAPFTVTSTGVLKANDATLENVVLKKANLTDATFINPNGQTCITTKEQTVYTGPDTNAKAVSSGMFINDTTGNNIAQLYYLSESQSGSQSQSGLRISTDSKTKFFSNVRDNDAQLYIGTGIGTGIGIGSKSLAYFSTYVQEGDLAVEFVSNGKCGIRIVGLPSYPNLTSAYSDSNLHESEMFLVSDNVTDNMDNVYEDHVVHIRGRRIQ